MESDARKHEFMSADWIAMARQQIVQAIGTKDLRGIDFTLCEEFTNAPAHLLTRGASTVGFYVRIANGGVEVGDHPIEDADLRLVSDYNDALPIARAADSGAADPRVMQERIATGKLTIIGDPTAAPATLADVDIHELLAPHTA